MSVSPENEKESSSHKKKLKFSCMQNKQIRTDKASGNGNPKLAFVIIIYKGNVKKTMSLFLKQTRNHHNGYN